jgi:hypothetical protein
LAVRHDPLEQDTEPSAVGEATALKEYMFAVKAAVTVSAAAGMVTVAVAPETEHAVEGAQDKLVNV